MTCYNALDYRNLIIVSGETYRFRQDDKTNEAYLTRAVRSMIMISRAMRAEEDVSQAVRIAAQNNIPRPSLESALNGRFGFDDPRIFTGE